MRMKADRSLLRGKCFPHGWTGPARAYRRFRGSWPSPRRCYRACSDPETGHDRKDDAKHVIANHERLCPKIHRFQSPASITAWDTRKSSHAGRACALSRVADDRTKEPLPIHNTSSATRRNLPFRLLYRITIHKRATSVSTTPWRPRHITHPSCHASSTTSPQRSVAPR